MRNTVLKIVSHSENGTKSLKIIVLTLYV